jgi:hypothetical protein
MKVDFKEKWVYMCRKEWVKASKSPEVAITMLLDLISLERVRSESMNRL